nr:hypothetical protein GPGIFMOB_00091 [Acinetobacter gerneri]
MESQTARLRQKYSFRPRVCKPYRAQTKGKVERFNGYLKSSFIVPLKASLKTSGLLLDVDVANAHIGRWLHETANQRIHATTQEKPAVRLQQEQRKIYAITAIRYRFQHCTCCSSRACHALREFAASLIGI